MMRWLQLHSAGPQKMAADAELLLNARAGTCHLLRAFSLVVNQLGTTEHRPA